MPHPPRRGDALLKALTGRGYRAVVSADLSADASLQLELAARKISVSCPARLGKVIEKAEELLHGGRQPQVFEISGYTLDCLARCWQTPSGQSTDLTDREVDLLAALIQAPDHSLSRAGILEKVWGYHQDAETHTLETHIYRLRRKIEKDAANPQILVTDGAGYKLVPGISR